MQASSLSGKVNRKKRPAQEAGPSFLIDKDRGSPKAPLAKSEQSRKKVIGTGDFLRHANGPLFAGFELLTGRR
jgi:hypothetical protein